MFYDTDIHNNNPRRGLQGFLAEIVEDVDDLISGLKNACWWCAKVMQNPTAVLHPHKGVEDYHEFCTRYPDFRTSVLHEIDTWRIECRSQYMAAPAAGAWPYDDDGCVSRVREVKGGTEAFYEQCRRTRASTDSAKSFAFVTQLDQLARHYNQPSSQPTSTPSKARATTGARRAAKCARYTSTGLFNIEVTFPKELLAPAILAAGPLKQAVDSRNNKGQFHRHLWTEGGRRRQRVLGRGGRFAEAETSCTGGGG
ncbi:hypothetical protein GGR53DRAFT_525764 [Hypoxylon sp. FL1150]|nr:hypothetical protein GGR53DRAFT_525764 [Hypoxylon sp. FL1150]